MQRYPTNVLLENEPLRRIVRTYLQCDEQRIDEVLKLFNCDMDKRWSRIKTARRKLTYWIAYVYPRDRMICKCGGEAPIREYPTQHEYFGCKACGKVYGNHYHDWEHRDRPITPGPAGVPRYEKADNSVLYVPLVYTVYEQPKSYPVIRWGHTKDA